MTNNPTIDGVSLAVLSDVFDELPDWNTPAATKLRALLDAPSCSICNDTGRVHEAGCDEGDCTRCLDATAALNIIHVGELDPAQRLALARGEQK